MSQEPQGSSSNRTILIVVSIIAGVVLLVVGCCGVGGYFIYQAMAPAISSGMQMVADLQQGQLAGQAFLTDLAADHLDEAYKRTSKNFQNSQDLEAFRKFMTKHPGLKNATCHIGFLGHGARVEFRNLRIKEL